MTRASHGLPKVSILLPVLNEQSHIDAALQSLADQDYPRDRFEILIAHGLSADDTAHRIDMFRESHSDLSICVRENSSGNTAIGRNLCLQDATGALALNFSGHAVADKQLLNVLVEKIEQLPKHVAGIGCAINRPDAETIQEKAIAAALFSPMGGRAQVDSSYHAAADGPARGVAFTLYHTPVLRDVGGFDDNFWCGQDAELNLRLARHGYELWFTPDVQVQHRKRGTIGSFVRQMYRYGVARAKLTRKFPSSLRLIFLLPSLFTLLLPAAAIGAYYNPLLRNATAMAGLIFVAASFWSVGKVRGGWVSLLCSPLIYIAMYGSYGFGFIAGFVKR